MEIDWTMPARLFIAAVSSGEFSQKPDFQADLRTCVDMARAWPEDVEFRLDTDGPVLGKTSLIRDDLALLTASH